MKMIAAVALVALAGIARASAPIVGEVFPWFEIGETVDAETMKGLRLFCTHKAEDGLRACAQYIIADATLPSNQHARVTLSVPDHKVLLVRREIECDTIDEAKELSRELIEQFKPLECGEGKKVLEISDVTDEEVVVYLWDKDYFREYKAWGSEEPQEVGDGQ